MDEMEILTDEQVEKIEKDWRMMHYLNPDIIIEVKIKRPHSLNYLTVSESGEGFLSVSQLRWYIERLRLHYEKVLESRQTRIDRIRELGKYPEAIMKHEEKLLAQAKSRLKTIQSLIDYWPADLNCKQRARKG